MGTHRITKVVAIRDAIDRLEWQVAIATDFRGTYADQAYALHWDGRVAFYHEHIASNSIPGPQHPKMTLPARWTNRERASRLTIPRETVFEFATDLPREALDHIESFRDSRRLYARLEGTLVTIHKEAPEGSAPWIHDLLFMMSSPHRTAMYIWTDSFELTRDFWSKELLGILRPPGRHILEIAVPIGSQVDDAASRTLNHIADAQRAFDEGSYSETARVCYRALDELNKFGQKVEGRYGKFARDRITAQIKETKSLCNSERHGNEPQHDGLEVDRVLAQHILAMTASLAGVVLR